MNIDWTAHYSPPGSAIRCFECNSHLNPNCSMAIPPNALSVECGDHKHGVSYTFCRKITQVIEFSVNNCKCGMCGRNKWTCVLGVTLRASPRLILSIRSTLIRNSVLLLYRSTNHTVPPDSRVIRGCGWDDSAYKNKCYQRSGFGGRLEVCACELDNCNGAVSLKSINSVLGFLCPLAIWAAFTRFF